MTTPELTPIDFCAEIEAAMVTELSLGLTQLDIATIGAAKPQKLGGSRKFKVDELPCIYVWCEADGPAEYIATMTLGIPYKLHFGIMTYLADPQQAKAQHSFIQSNAVAFLSSAYYKGNSTMLDSGAPAWIDDLNPQEPERGEKSDAFTFHSQNSCRIVVYWPDPALGA